uniref:Uncharacterized protein n=1 Tax=Gadus morhua TaxID=8049 RepID=A0A8C4ZB66_GADMO
HQQDVEVDITMGEEERLWMCRNIPQDKHPEVGKPLTPKIFNGDRYCWGKDSPDYEDFFQSKENNGVFAFLGCSSSQALEKVYCLSLQKTNDAICLVSHTFLKDLQLHFKPW